MSSRTAPHDLHDHTYFSSAETRGSLAELYAAVRSLSRKLCEPLVVEDYVVQSMEDASPTKWHLAHTSWFFEIFVLAAGDPQYESLHPQYSYLFNSYYVQAGERYPRPQRGLLTRPTVEEVVQYRQYIDEQMLELIENVGLDTWNRLAPIIEIGIHHEQQHQELMLTDVKHVLSFNPLHPTYRERDVVSEESSAAADWIVVSEGMYLTGHDGKGFCYDNEMPRHRHHLESFELCERLVTNAEYLDFVQDGSYGKPTLWLSDGWYAVEREKWQAPLYWTPLEGEWHYFTLSGLREVNPGEPVCHISFYEADAFARWAGARLPTEQEWEVMAEQSDGEGNFVANQAYHPLPLNCPQNRRRPLQIFGDVWEWTQSPYSPYPRYKPMRGALGEYNGKFMSGQMVLRGGSCATSQSHIRSSYRNFFHPRARWQFSGLRLARDPA